MTLLATCESIINQYQAGKISKSEANAKLLVAARKAQHKALKQTDNSNLPAEVRMGCSKKGYTRPTLHA